MKDFTSLKDGKDIFKDILYTKENWVATITINRPDAYNSYTTNSLKELIRALEDASWDDSVSCIVMTGAGDKAFCTGGDVKEYAEKYTLQPRQYWKYMGLFREFIEGILEAGKPVIARLNGMAVGGGNEVNLACDLSVIGEHTYVGQVGTSVGSVACGGATQWLPITVGEKRARQMLFLNERIPAKKALEWGLVNIVVPTVKKNNSFIDSPSQSEIEKAHKKTDGFEIDFSKLDEAVNSLTMQIKDKFSECMRYTKTQLNFFKELVWHSTIGHGADWLSLHFACLEPFEGMKAFVEKRKPQYEKLRKSAAEGGSSEFLWGPNTKSCPKCNTKYLPQDFKFCGVCGASL